MYTLHATHVIYSMHATAKMCNYLFRKFLSWYGFGRVWVRPRVLCGVGRRLSGGRPGRVGACCPNAVYDRGMVWISIWEVAMALELSGAIAHCLFCISELLHSHSRWLLIVDCVVLLPKYWRLGIYRLHNMCFYEHIQSVRNSSAKTNGGWVVSNMSWETDLFPTCYNMHGRPFDTLR